MPSNKPIFTLRTEKINLEKLHIIAKKESRSDNQELEYILLKYIKEYEETNGIINIEKA